MRKLTTYLGVMTAVVLMVVAGACSDDKPNAVVTYADPPAHFQEFEPAFPEWINSYVVRKTYDHDDSLSLLIYMNDGSYRTLDATDRSENTIADHVNVGDYVSWDPYGGVERNADLLVTADEIVVIKPAHTGIPDPE